MIKRLFFLFLASMYITALFVVPAVAYAAQAVTVTPTATFIPPSATPQPLNTICPVGTPAGWGTYTPSPLWGMTCGSCSSIVTPTSTGTPSPIPTWNGTGTPPSTMTVTPTVAVTSTLVPIPSLVCDNTLDHWDCTNYDATTLKYTHLPDFSAVNRMRFQPIPFHTSLYGTLYVGGWYHAHGFTSAAAALWDSQGVYPTPLYMTSCGGVYTTPSFPSGTSITSAWFYRFVLPGTYNFTLKSDNGNCIGFGSSGILQFYSDVYVLLSAVPSNLTSTPAPTSTITSTPYIDSGYCSSVAPTETEFGWNLFIDDGEPNCDLGWDEIAVGDLIIPAVQICFQPSQFGVVTMFGESYEIGVFALAAAAAFMWRFLRTV